MVATVDHLASSAGLRALLRGGTAADAAIAANAVLTVTSPHLCGMGGDLFALVHDPHGEGTPLALDAAGRAGRGTSAAALRAEGHRAMPFKGDIRTATVPGCVDGWVALHERFGRLPLAELLEPAARYAAAGFPASPLLAAAVALLQGVPGAGDLTGERTRRAGERIERPGLRETFEAITVDGRDGFYRGRFGAGLLELGRGWFSDDDLAVSQARWVEPLRVDVWGHAVWTMPPPSQGYLTLLGAAIAVGLPLPEDTEDPAWAHLLVESARAAAHDRLAVLHDGADVAALLAGEEVRQRRALVDPGGRAALATPTGTGDTTYLCAIDHEGMGVSLIQSNASGFGTHVFEPSTGIGLHNRGIGFSLEPGHPAELAPGRQPPHTLSPALVTRPDGSLRAVLGTMGGDAQPQVVLQLLTRLLRHKQSPGRTIGSPRWALGRRGATGFDTWAAPDEVVVEVEAAGGGWAEGLRARGHEVEVVARFAPGFGHAQLIERRLDGMLGGAADPRAEVEAAAGY